VIGTLNNHRNVPGHHRYTGRQRNLEGLDCKTGWFKRCSSSIHSDVTPRAPFGYRWFDLLRQRISGAQNVIEAGSALIYPLFKAWVEGGAKVDRNLHALSIREHPW